jgi:hypothetical protein
MITQQFTYDNTYFKIMPMLRTKILNTYIKLIEQSQITKLLASPPNPLHLVILDNNGLVFKLTDVGSLNSSHLMKPEMVMKGGAEVNLFFEYLHGKPPEWINKYARYPFLRLDDWMMCEIFMDLRRVGHKATCEFTERDHTGKVVSRIELHTTSLTSSMDVKSMEHTFQGFDRIEARASWHHLIQIGFKPII